VVVKSSLTNTIKVLRGDQARSAVGALDAASISTFDVSSRAGASGNPLATFEREREAARAAGYNDGLMQAQADIAAATEQANNRVRFALAALQEAIDGFDQRETIAIAGIEDVIIQSAFEIAQSILQRELTVAADPGADALARALQMVPERGHMVARLNPMDAETLGMTEVNSRTRTVEIVADASIEAGGCIVEAGDARIDAQISSALTNVADALGIVTTVDAGRIAPHSRTTPQESPES
jgi:flagellar assembly protein FliH